MENFKFEVITKILAYMLASMMPNLISLEQRGFIHGRKIQDCVFLALEVANFMHKKSFDRNIALKIDVAKAFDTLKWPLLLKK